jgi:hypothetical protein
MRLEHSTLDGMSIEAFKDGIGLAIACCRSLARAERATGAELRSLINRASARPIRFLVATRAQFVAKLPGLGIGALSTAAFEFAEPVTLAHLIAGAK